MLGDACGNGGGGDCVSGDCNGGGGVGVGGGSGSVGGCSDSCCKGGISDCYAKLSLESHGLTCCLCLSYNRGWLCCCCWWLCC